MESSITATHLGIGFGVGASLGVFGTFFGFGPMLLVTFTGLAGAAASLMLVLVARTDLIAVARAMLAERQG